MMFLIKYNKLIKLKHGFHGDIRKFIFTPIVVNIWKSLLSYMYVIDVNFVDLFMSR